MERGVLLLEACVTPSTVPPAAPRSHRASSLGWRENVDDKTYKIYTSNVTVNVFNEFIFNDLTRLYFDDFCNEFNGEPVPSVPRADVRFMVERTRSQRHAGASCSFLSLSL